MSEKTKPLIIDVLLIEDSPDDAFFIREMLSGADDARGGFRLTHADRLSDGLAHLAQHRLDVVLLDLGLPDSLGLHAYGKIRAQAADVPVIVLSGLDDEALAVEAVGYGAQDYLVKGTVDSNLLARAIHHAIERKRLEQEAEKRRQYLESVLACAPDAIVALDTNHRVLEWNRGAEALFGYSEGETIGRDLDRLVTGPDVDARHEARSLTKVVLGGQSIPPFETVRYRKDGTPVDVVAAGSPILVGDELVGVVAVYTDITERKRAQEALKRYSERLEEMVEERTKKLRDAQEQLVRREKLAILGQLAGGVGHELRNPLGVISNAVYFLQMTLVDADEATREYLGLIHAEVRNATRIVSGLLDYARTRPADRQEVPVTALVADVLDRHPPPPGVQVATEVPADLPPAFVDPAQIGLVQGNLVRNAYQAMPEGGTLTISGRTADGHVELSVADDGCGISSENMRRLFEPLYTTKARGIGLGLAICKNLVEANGGRIRVQSREGDGSTFTITMPTREATS
jgi:PAS domain S-box-containing protein